MAGQNFFLYEPTLLFDGRVCVPTRWFLRGKKTCAKVWFMSPTSSQTGWLVDMDNVCEIDTSEMNLSFPELKNTFKFHRLPDPCMIKGMDKLITISY